jgi:hypothetical protein
MTGLIVFTTCLSLAVVLLKTILLIRLRNYNSNIHNLPLQDQNEISYVDLINYLLKVNILQLPLHTRYIVLVTFGLPYP